MRRMKGITITSLPVLGSTQQYKVVAYADYVEPVFTSMQEWAMVGTVCNQLEGASGAQLHRDPRSEKV